MKTIALLLLLALASAKMVASTIVPPIPGKLQFKISQGQLQIAFSRLEEFEYQLLATDDLDHPWEVIQTSPVGYIGAIFRFNMDARHRFYRVAGPNIEVQIDPERMVWIAPGTFVMGSPNDEVGRDDDEGPLTTVTISQGFWMSRYKVTQGEYEAVMGDNLSNFNGPGGWPEGSDYGIDLTRPMDSPNWTEAVEYCTRITWTERKAAKIPGNFSYRLPTEAEWEYACRAGTTTRFYYGDDPDYSGLTDYGWYSDNSNYQTHSVGQKLPNEWGLYDMHGSLWEWCLDWYSDSLPGGVITDPKGPSSGSERVVRGGNWFSYAQYCRSANRFGYQPSTHDFRVGFRVVLGPAPVE